MLEYFERTEGSGHFLCHLYSRHQSENSCTFFMYFRQKRAQLLWSYALGIGFLVSILHGKTGQDILGNAEMVGLTPPAVLSRRCSFRLPFVSIDGTLHGSPAFPLLWRSQKMDRFVDRLKRRIVFSKWYPTIARDEKK